MPDLVDEILSGRQAAPAAARERDLVDEILSPNAPQAPPQQAGPQVGYGEGIARAALQGLTFGFGDEMGAATYAAIPGLGGAQTEGWSNRYGENLEAARAKHKAFSKENPVASGLSEVGGAIVSAIATRGAGRLGRVLAPSAGRTMLGTMARGAAAGTTGGAIAGFGSGEGGFENRVDNAVIPAVVGGVVGGAAPPLVNMASRAFGKVADATGLRNNTRAAYRQTLRAIGRDQDGGGPGLDAIQRSMAANVGDNYRPEMLPDVGGQNLNTLAATAARTPGQAAQKGAQALDDRVAQQAGRIMDDTARLVNPNRDYHGTIAALDKGKKKAANPLYEAFHNEHPVWSDRLGRLLDNPKIKEGLNRGLRIMRNEADANDVPLDWKALKIDFDPEGNAILTDVPGPKVLDYIKRGIDDVLETYRDKTTGTLRLDTEGSGINGLRKAFVKELDNLYPDTYAAARAAYAGPSHAQDVIAQGRNIFSPDSEITAEMVRKMNQTDKDYFAVGVVRAIRDKVMAVGDNNNAAAAIWKNPLLREKLAAAFPDPANYRKFSGLMEREMNMMKKGSQRHPNVGSGTQKWMAAERDMEIDPTVINDLRQGQPGKALMGGITRYFTSPPTQGMNSATADELARILYSTSQQDNMQTVARLAREASRPGTLTERQMRDLARALSLGQGAAAGTQSN